MTIDDKIFKHFRSLGKIKLFLYIIVLGFALFFLTMFIFGDFDDIVSYSLRIFFTLIFVVLFSFGIKNALRQINIRTNKSKKIIFKSIDEINIYNNLISVALSIIALISLIKSLQHY